MPLGGEANIFEVFDQLKIAFKPHPEILHQLLFQLKPDCLNMRLAIATKQEKETIEDLERESLESDHEDIAVVRAEFTKTKITKGLESVYLSPLQVFEKLDTHSDN